MCLGVLLFRFLLFGYCCPHVEPSFQANRCCLSHVKPSLCMAKSESSVAWWTPFRPCHEVTQLSFSLFISRVPQVPVPLLEPNVSVCDMSLYTGYSIGCLGFQQPSVSLWQNSEAFHSQMLCGLLPALVFWAGVGLRPFTSRVPSALEISLRILNHHMWVQACFVSVLLLPVSVGFFFMLCCRTYFRWLSRLIVL